MIFEIEIPLKGRLFIGPMPPDSLADFEVFAEKIKANQIETVVTLMESNEKGCATIRERLSTFDFSSVHFPIEDFGIPTDDEKAKSTISSLLEMLKNGASIFIHCRGGIGRSSMISAALLIALKVPSEKAWQQIQDARGVVVPETLDQQVWAEAFAAKIA